jgi:hypothetical protein
VETAHERKQLAALQAAAKFLRKYAKCFPAGFVPTNTAQQAILAIKVYEVFLHYTNKPENTEQIEQNHEIIEAVMVAYEKFAAGENA